MPTEAVTADGAAPARASRRLDLASLRILRMALGVSLSLLFSQVVGWDLSFIAPVFTLLLLSVPLPVLSPKQAIGFVVVLAATSAAGLALLPVLIHQRAAGVLLLALALFGSFYYTARGGSMLLGTFATMGLALSTAIGTVSVDAVLTVIRALLLAAIAGIPFVWLAHAIFPDSSARVDPPPPGAAPKPSPPPPPGSAVATRSALRSLSIVLPVCLWFVLSAASASYLVVMIKVSQMGQQSSVIGARTAAKSFLLSTFIGGVAATLAWEALRIWPNLVLYVLLVALAGLIMGPRIFAGRALAAGAGTWSYAYVTMFVILAPAVMDGAGGSTADARFWDRMLIFAGATLYGVVAVRVYDAFFGMHEA
jgi:hypothetical protein